MIFAQYSLSSLDTCIIYAALPLHLHLDLLPNCITTYHRITSEKRSLARLLGNTEHGVFRPFPRCHKFSGI